MGSTPVQHSVLNVKAVVAAFNQEKALVGAFSVIVKSSGTFGEPSFQALVREQREEMVSYLVSRGARVFYPDHDPSCPLQLACKTPLLKESGQVSSDWSLQPNTDT